MPSQPVEKIPFVSQVCQGKYYRFSRTMAFASGLLPVPYRQKRIKNSTNYIAFGGYENNMNMAPKTVPKEKNWYFCDPRKKPGKKQFFMKTRDKWFIKILAGK